MNHHLPTPPSCWSDLTWKQLCKMWSVKQQYGGNADLTRTASLLSLLGLSVLRGCENDKDTGESIFRLMDECGRVYTVSPRELSFMAKKVIPWFDFPYGDPGEKERKDEKGQVLAPGRDAVRGYVSPMRDAMILPEDYVRVGRRYFALPQVACNNLTWQQYRSLQTVSPQLFTEGMTDEQTIELQARFLAHILVPRTVSILDTWGGSMRLRPHYEYKYSSDQAEHMALWFQKRMLRELRRKVNTGQGSEAALENHLSTLFHICVQTYQTALGYYSEAYPLLFAGDGKNDQMRDALQGEVGTVNTIMKYAGYTEQQQVYDSNLPFVLDILNTMTKEAKDIEKMNAKIKHKK